MNCTDYTNVFGRARWPGAPQRVLKTPFYVEWKNLPDHETEETQPIIGQSIIHGVVCIGCLIFFDLLPHSAFRSCNNLCYDIFCSSYSDRYCEVLHFLGVLSGIF